METDLLRHVSAVFYILHEKHGFFVAEITNFEEKNTWQVERVVTRQKITITETNEHDFVTLTRAKEIIERNLKTLLK